MAYVIIPLQPLANQSFTCILDNAPAQIKLETTDYGLFASIVYNGNPVATSRLCLDRTDLNSARYNGLPQSLFFADLQGINDPTFDGFGTRYVLCYGPPPTNAVGSQGFAFFPAHTGRLDIDFFLDESILG